ncbi:predicted protein [Histoplasma capsulatum G186AR]|uniref:Uncharacterized protein n=1 Tax=Ajellomyces capsulatus (strain G186AR / H82 / ATCC MYA-2454 / RMSCC 2432) TaxID=447093 RepID=C0NAS9_AJECG|nr:uncharacterized protein HCBG_00225 [Histoplasma capsulatum G186AR]EEH10770.1 predicted protein [Histoplasma capsulatum G186AR]
MPKTGRDDQESRVISAQRPLSAVWKKYLLLPSSAKAELTAINLEIIHGSLKVQIHEQLRRNKQCDDSMPQVITTSERNQFRVPRHPSNYRIPENNRGGATGDDNNARDRLSAVKMPDKRVSNASASQTRDDLARVLYLSILRRKQTWLGNFRGDGAFAPQFSRINLRESFKF